MRKFQLWKTSQFSAVIIGQSGFQIYSMFFRKKKKDKSPHWHSLVSTSSESLPHRVYGLSMAAIWWSCLELPFSQQYHLHVKLNPPTQLPLTTLMSLFPMISLSTVGWSVEYLRRHNIAAQIAVMRIHSDRNIGFDFLLSAAMPVLLS